MKNLFSYLNQYGPLSESTLEIIQSACVYDELKKDDYFVREGEYANEIAFLEQGAVRAFYTNKQGKEYNKTFFTAPAIIGSYASLISKEKNRLPQQALSDCAIWRISFDVIERLSGNSIELERLRRNIAEQFFVWNEKKQLEMALLDAKERYLIFKDEHPGLEETIPQYHIASYLGISATQLSRIRKK
ncbi:Crp/Fnr family transcriptional regulator [Aestuariirhabdus sp. Z084]|uniref:Crp/Fnr family transcriptional regulator n=1 Tax=Aestuariirhabdus haliotis TaxID=2918751 RepID=UPI00201B3F38|nr:Crp/Fnr family transcriptional regulator [Aestuariirhabdus haliotis]MCL6416597.1 Crp/Fnr family transcriptional regulator [Aestuariirhabdus haliotis]MCL6420632.1 Crp/Fnr family transcriptional regulator [Aestuariirhabdus haliotis]